MSGPRSAACDEQGLHAPDLSDWTEPEWGELAPWPESIPPAWPVWEYRGGRVVTTFSFRSVGREAQFWLVGDTCYSTIDNEPADFVDAVFAGRADSTDAVAALAWMEELHRRIDAGAYSLAFAAASPARNANVMA